MGPVFTAQRSIAVAGAFAAAILTVAASGASGDLDPSFGSGGISTADFGSAERAVGTVLQPDGKIVVAGTAWPSVPGFMLARFNADGTLDSGFGAGGLVHTHAMLYADTAAVALQGDGRIVAAGSTYGGADFLLARFLPNGAVDPSFGTGGMLVTDFGGSEIARALAIQADGKIVAVGSRGSSGAYGDFVVARYMPSGVLDPSFDGDGRVTITFPGRLETGDAVALRRDGRMTIGGASIAGGNLDIALAQINRDGSLDTSFDGDGRVVTDLGAEDFAKDIAFDSDGRIIVAGYRGFSGSSAVLRYTDAGALDGTFDGDGIALIDFGPFTPSTAWSLAVQRDGRIVSAGGIVANGMPAFALARLNADGTLDTSFSGDGKASAGVDAFARDVTLQRDGGVLVAGRVGPDIAVARFEGDPLNPNCRRGAGICG